MGWATRLADMYQRKADVIVRGFSGYNTAWLLKMLPDLFSRLFRRRPPALVTIWLGACPSGRKGVLPYDARLSSIIQHLARSTHHRV